MIKMNAKSTGRILTDSRIDSFYKATKLCHRNPKRSGPKEFSSPIKTCDMKACNIKQITLSPWLIKKPLIKIPSCDCKFQRRKRRHILSPKKGAAICDPLFRGATIWFDTKWKGDESQLVITSFFSKRCKLSRYEKRRKYGSEEWKLSSDDEDIEYERCDNFRSDMTSCLDKRCESCRTSRTSCRTSRTPLWRDAEDGTPLCNACGIRYRKYKRRCSQCWYIPRKGKEWYNLCFKCGCHLTYNNRLISRIIK